jgi:opacity protein-like surface antigen
MKKLFYLVVLLLGISAHSQILQFGVKGGLNTSTLSGDGDISSLTGFHAGVFASIDLVIIDVVPELVYSTQGASFGNQDVNLNYFNVPIMARLNLLKILYLEAGPQFGFLVGADDGTDNSKDNYESTDFSVGVGAGVELFDTFDVGLRYNFGTTDVTKAPGDYKNNVFQIGLAYKF